MTRAPLSHFAQLVSDFQGISLPESIRLLALDAGIHGARDLPIHALANIVMVEHSDGSLECADSFTQRLADRFAHLIRDSVGCTKFAEIVRRNRTREYRDTHSCASHEFCDANIAMLAVFRELGYPEDEIVDGVGNSDHWVHREWCAAWDRFISDCNL